MSLTSELLKTTNIKGSSMIAESKIFTDSQTIRTNIPALNVALSGSITGGYGSGITIFAAPSKSFKTMFSLILLKAFQKKYKDGTIIFYDSEFGSPPEYLQAAGLDLDNIIHIPIMDLEETKFDMIKKLESIKRKDNVLIFIDSIGNLASKKEVEDAKDEKSVADMSRAKQLKSLFRMVTPYLSTLDIPLIAVNHTYQEIGLFPKTIMGGGCLLAGTKIQMADGSLENVEDIQVGELVKTLNGHQKVTETWNPDTLTIGEPECYKIEFEDGYKVTCSDTHKFLIDGNWVEAKDLKLSDNVTTGLDKELKMKVVGIEKVGKLPVYDLSVDIEENYVLENGVVTHNTGALYSSNNIFFITKSQEKEGTEFVGSKFTIVAEKSRTIKEKSKIPVTVTFDKGVDVFSGVVEWGMEYGSIIKPKNGWYALVDMETGEVQEPNLRLKDLSSPEHLLGVLKDKKFQEFVTKKYKLTKDDFVLVKDVINMDELD